MEKITRTEAVAKISRQMMSILGDEARENLLLNWWGIDEEDEEFWLLSKELQTRILEEEEVPADFRAPLFDELLLIAVSSQFVGVTNDFLTETLVKESLGYFEVFGAVEELETCPCCGYKTLTRRGEWHICGLCYWEDDGTAALERHSGPNHMTLREAKAKFLREQSALPLHKWVRE